MAARNMSRIEINIYEKLCIKLIIYKDHSRMHGKQNTKFRTLTLSEEQFLHDAVNWLVFIN